MTYINSFDKKLADGFDNNIDFDTIISSMGDDEIYEMWDFLEGEIGRDYSYTTFKEAKVLICEDYCIWASPHHNTSPACTSSGK